ncbi:helix-turn-helix transcriptional regulator [Streptomyces sp. NPDC051597]|uniref:helix-turn-helix domain-containing protein n=1 Tax=Streptomyces sp. NPDC051597 TaxID=3155049 RepID=UPI00342EA2B3
MGLGLEESLRLTVAALMQATGQSQRDLAEVLGLTQTQVSRRQAGTTAWSLRDCDVLAAHYGIGPLDLLAGPTRACEALPAGTRRGGGRSGRNANVNVKVKVNVRDGVAGR